MPDFETITMELSEELAGRAVGKFWNHPDHDLLLSVARERAREFVGQQHTRTHVVWYADRAAVDWLRVNSPLSRRQMLALRSGKLKRDDPAVQVAYATSLDDTALRVAVDVDDPADVAERADMVELLKACLAELPERERDILWSRADGVELKELADRYGVSKQRVSQLEMKALDMLKELAQNRA